MRHSVRVYLKQTAQTTDTHENPFLRSAYHFMLFVYLFDHENSANDGIFTPRM